MVGEEAAELGLEDTECGGQEPAVEVAGGGCPELVERDPEVGEEARVGEVAVAEVLDNVGEPLRGEPAVVGEEPMRLLELGQDGEVAGQVPGSAGVCGGSRPCTASNTLSTAAAGPTARSMLGPAVASASRGARIGRTDASMAGRRAWMASSLGASAWLSARDFSRPARSARRAARRLAMRRASSWSPSASWDAPILSTRPGARAPS